VKELNLAHLPHLRSELSTLGMRDFKKSIMRIRKSR
jgi:hypothetical protein